jgi:thioredoxin reductase
MEFWQKQMPAGMFLRSSWAASHIADPQQAMTLDAYSAQQRVQVPAPVPLDKFVAYGQWFQRQVAPDLERRRVVDVKPNNGDFCVHLVDGEVFKAKRVVVAAGIAPFASRPPQFDGLPASLVSHTSEHCDLSQFAHTKVVVIGGGQSAIETAVLLYEAGADVEVIMRAPRLRWLVRSSWLHNHDGFIRDLLYPPTDVGPPGLNQLVARPNLFRQLPRKPQQRIAYRSIRPAAAGWLFSRSRQIRMITGCQVISALPTANRIEIQLDDGSKRTIDHVMLGTGYRVDVAHYPFISAELIKALRQVEGYPILNSAFESSVPGLYFVGAPAAHSFGPLMRFVSGTGFTARTLTSGIVGQSGSKQ